MRSKSRRHGDRGVRRRVWLFAVALVFFNLGPALTWATGVRLVPFWQMYNAYGQGICRVELAERTSDGALVPVDRFTALAVTRWEAPPSVRRVEDERDARRLTRRLCTGPFRGRDLRMRVACGATDGWREVTTFDDGNVCAPRRARKRP